MNAGPGNCRASALSRSDGMQLLRDAWECASEIEQDPWQLAIEIDSLHRAGLTNTDLRWLLSRELTQHAAEITRRTDARRRFAKLRSLALADNHCFVLTGAGYRFADVHREPAEHGVDAMIDSSNDSPPGDANSDATAEHPAGQVAAEQSRSSNVPTWDGDLHEMWFGGRMIKRFVRPAPAQELILSVFQEEGWPSGIDDPLPAKSCQDPKRRLHYTVQNLNRGQKPQRLHFFINGNGQIVRWQPVTTSRKGR